MLNKILATMAKEWLTFRRDVAGVALILFMPAILIIVMSLTQDAPFKDYQQSRFDVLLTDEDQGPLSREIVRGLIASGHFNVITADAGRPLDAAAIRNLIGKGKYKVGVVIPKGVSAEVVNAANTLANRFSKTNALPARDRRDSVAVRMYFDPVTKPTFRLSVGFALDKFISLAYGNVLLHRLGTLSGNTDTSKEAERQFAGSVQGIRIRQEFTGSREDSLITLNSVQHNVPVWAIFGMFFIVIPIAGNVIRERDERSALRVAIIPGSAWPVSIGRILFYMMVSTVQFYIMIGIGVYLMPYFGLDSLRTGSHPLTLFFVCVSIAFAATTFGYFTGSVFRTTNQALPFGAIAIVILSALGGIWVPLDLLPPVMQRIALISPLHWSLEMVNDIFLRRGGFPEVAANMCAVVLISLLLWLISAWRRPVASF